MTQHLPLKKITDLHAGDHLCCLYHSEDEQKRLLLPQFKQVLERNEKVLYMSGNSEQKDYIQTHLLENGLDIQAHIETGQINFIHIDDENPMRNLTADQVNGVLDTETSKALAKGYSGLRVFDEVHWALADKPGTDWLVEHEVKMNDFLANSKCIVVCQYHLSYFQPKLLLDLVIAHPMLALRDDIHDNFYYMPPASYLGTGVPPEKILDRWLENLMVRREVEIENARLMKEIQARAETDSLTGLPNRRTFDISFPKEVKRAQRYGHYLALIMIDVDNFKVFNDTYGHPAGDKRLREIAQLLEENSREPDIAARWGGEEFAFLLPHTDASGVTIFAERLRALAAAVAPEIPQPGTPHPGYTMSFGVAVFPKDAKTADSLLHAADQALLLAKRDGKNRVYFANNNHS